jgi:hypothetical protein
MNKSNKNQSHLDTNLQKALAQETARFQKTEIPMITVSASYKEDVKGFYGYNENESIPDVVFSRAHYSMALGVAVSAWQGTQSLSKTKVKPEKAYVVDPTNFVSYQDWSKITFTEQVGKILARKPFFKRLKDFIDQFARQKLPILASIEIPIIQLSANLKKPVLSFHIAAGNLLATQNKTVVQVITDPHVREEYLENAESENFHYCVFDKATKFEVLEKSALLKKIIDPNRVIVTGPPIDPRIIQASHKKNAWRSGPLKICLTTGGLGTNSYEIRLILQKLLPLLRKHQSKKMSHSKKHNLSPVDQPPNLDLELMVYASTHKDIAQMVAEMAKKERVALQTIDSRPALKSKLPKPKLTLLYHPQIVDANELLIDHAFPWADGFITKPSGDMAYDAASSGCFLLTLQEWGEWEHNVRERFESLNIARKCQIQDVDKQLAVLTDSSRKSQSWVEQAMNSALSLPEIYLSGAKNIISAYESVLKSKNK